MAVLGLLLVLSLLPTWNLPRAKSRVLQALERALGRRVTADEVHLVLFPWPGIELVNLHVAEAPPFGAEDMLTAETARATLRLLSLWSGRLEFSTVRLEYPSLNLVHAAAPGVGWNVASLLDQASARGPSLRATTEGTSLRQALGAPVRFPYLEFAHGRVNFKEGWTKSRIYLDELEGSVALEESVWRVHVRFATARTDVSLTNSGDVTVDGTFAAARQPLRDLPFDLTVRVQNAYLPAVSDLVWGRDRGVYGIANLVARLQGTGSIFQVTGNVQGRALRRWDLLPPPVAIQAGFVATYDVAADQLTIHHLGDPAGAHITITGRVAHLLHAPQPTLHAVFRQVPTADLLMLVRAVKANLPPDLTATGTFDGEAGIGTAISVTPISSRMTRPAKPSPRAAEHAALWSGWLRGENVALQTGEERVQIPTLQAVFNPVSANLRWTVPLTAVVVSTGQKRQSPLQLGGFLDAQGFQVQFVGTDVSAETWASLAHVWGFDSPWNPALRGNAQLACAVSATWSTFRHPQWSGEMVLPTASYTVRAGLPPLLLAPLLLRLGVNGGDGVSQAVHASGNADTGPFEDPASAPIENWVRGDFSGTWRGVKLDGWVSWPLTTMTVPTRFKLHLAHVTNGDIVAYFSTYMASPPGGLLGSVLFASGRVAPWPYHPAEGTLQVEDWEIGGVPVQAQASLQIATRPDGGSDWNVPTLRVNLAGGHFAGKAAVSDGELTLAGQASGLQLEAWAAATVVAKGTGAPRNPTGLAADVRGLLSGNVNFSCPLSANRDTWRADGEAVLERAQVPVVEGGRTHTEPLTRVATSYQLRRGLLQCNDGRLWRKRLQAPFHAEIDLHQPPWAIRFSTNPGPPAPQSTKVQGAATRGRR